MLKCNQINVFKENDQGGKRDDFLLFDALLVSLLGDYNLRHGKNFYSLVFDFQKKLFEPDQF